MAPRLSGYFSPDKTRIEQVINQFDPVHLSPFNLSSSRNISIRQSETEAEHDSTMSTLAERLIEARTEKGWRKADLKRAAGLKSPSTLTDLESGHATESPQLPRIAEALGVEVLWLQHGRGPKQAGRKAPHQQAIIELDPVLADLAALPPDEAEIFRAEIKLAALKARKKWGEPPPPKSKQTGTHRT